MVNPVACENTLPGDPATDWDITGSGDPSIQGFPTDISVNVGGTIHFKIDTKASSYHFDILRVGYYGGNGARKVASGLVPGAPLPQTQPACLNDPTTGLVDCGNWGESASWAVPSTAVSGVYMAHLKRDDTGGESHILFIVRNDQSHSDVVFSTSDPTWQAYNRYGGNNFYVGSPAPPVLGSGRAYKVSYNRPIITRDCCQEDYFFHGEYPLIRFMESNGYDMSYMSGLDVDRGGASIKQHRVYMDGGHDEYWSGAARANVQAARDAGVNLAFIAGNNMYWKTRWEPSIDGTSTSNRTLVCYKETWANAKIDPTPAWTGTFRDPRFSAPPEGGQPENALVGTIFTVNSGTFAAQVPSTYSKLRFWRNTDAASLAPGQTLTLAPNTVGYEWNEDLDNGFRPPGLFDMSAATNNVPQKLLDYGSTVAAGTATHHLTLYRAASGALVFSSGTVQYEWGLDDTHDGAPGPSDPNIQQAMVNLLADMNAQPGTLQAPLVPASRTTDTTPPTSVVAAPAAGSTATVNQPTTISGTATDAGGGVVAGVEVSTDGGTTWHPAQGTSSWSYQWVPTATGTAAIRTRAVDDSGNIGPSSGITVTAAVTCPCSIWSSAAAPETASSGDGAPIEVGVRFHSDVPGFVTGLRFYKGDANTGTHVGHLWTASGTLLGSATFSNETVNGWQQVTFASPLAVSANSSYIASYFAPSGNYSIDYEYFATGGHDAGYLHAERDGAGSSDGLYLYAQAGGYPTSSFEASNYWVDVTFVPTNAPYVTSTSPTQGATSVATTTAVTATFNKAIAPSTLSFGLTDSAGAQVPAAVSYNAASLTATLQPTAALVTGTRYSATVAAQDTAGNAASPYPWSFVTAGVRPCPCSIWSGGAAPTVPVVADNSSIELGVKFTSDVSGYINGVRFFKGSANSGTHVGNLWSLSGTLLASATFINETASGWQEVSFASQVPVTAGTTYVASYFAPAGDYAADGHYLDFSTDNPPLHAPSGSTSGGNGVYHYGASSGFPTSSFANTNYWVDPVFTTQPDAAPPTVVAQSPSPNATGVALTTTVTTTFNEAVQAGSLAFALTAPGGAVVGGATGYNAVTHVATFMPATPLTAGTAYTASVRATDGDGNAMVAPVTWSFATVPLPTNCPCSIFTPTSAPATFDAGDPSSVELGVRFTADVSGYVTGVRFYKAAANSGTHAGSLWSASGQLLARATFINESASGWQQVNFDSQVAVMAGTTYVASYFAPSGHYSASAGALSSSLDNPPLHALSNASAGGNGVYSYGAGSVFPSSSYNATNYWVDVVFAVRADSAPPTVTSTTPAASAAGVLTTRPVTATFSEAVQALSVAFSLTGPGGTAVPATTAYNATTHVATLTPSAPLAAGTTYAASIRATDGDGNPMASPFGWSFTTLAPNCPCTIFGGATPNTVDAGDGGSVEVGTKFTSDVAGYVTGVRFYKSTGNTGTHIGSLWNSAGQRLASATFINEGASGWQQVSFDSQVAITAGTTYVVSYFAPSGHYSADGGAFANGVDNPPLHALSSSSGGNGVYVYGAGSAFPTGTFNATNYWVDPIFSFQADTAAPSLIATSPVAGATGVGVSSPVTATFNEAVQAPSIVFTLSGPGGAVGGASGYNVTTHVATFTPSSPLVTATTYTASLRATDGDGNAMAAPQTWSFTTIAPSCPCTIFGNAAPAVADAGDGSSLELGLKFTADVSGHVTGVRFYKSAANTGTHLGNLWSASGQLLATATFVNESASGWQAVSFSAPVAVTAGTTYVVSYFDPRGHYAATGAAFASAGVDNMPLHALSNSSSGGNGVYISSAGSAFPTSSFNATNYWVDVVFSNS